jgi:PleD family two-component response regulator
VERCQKERPELAILDVTMPRLGGLEACARMKALPGAYVPVIMVSARSDLGTRLSCLAVAEDFVAKPYDPDEICARVEAHLRTRRLTLGRASSPALPDARTLAMLPDRAALLDRINEAFRRSARSSEPLALLVAGPDGAGAPVIQALGQALGRAVREGDVVARTDDAHLAALLFDQHVTAAMSVADRLRRELGRVVDGPAPSVSMGIAVHPGREVQEPADLLRVAERALARARGEGPGRICIFQHQGYLFEPV